MSDDPARPGPAASAANLASGLETMRSSLAAVIAESQALRQDVKEAEAGRKRSSSLALALLVVLVILVALGVVITAQNASVVHKVDGVAGQVASCTTPAGQCYQKGNERTGQAISDVIRAEIYVAECARLYPDASGPVYDAKIEACVRAKLAKPIPPRASMSPSPAAGTDPR